MGNIWMFPARVSKYGGGTFLLPYFLFVIMIGLSGVIGEMAFGRAARSGPIGAFGQAMASRGKGRRLGEAIGYIPVLGSLALAIGYSVIVGWILRYSAGSLTGTTLAPGDVDGFTLAFSSMAGASEIISGRLLDWLSPLSSWYWAYPAVLKNQQNNHAPILPLVPGTGCLHGVPASAADGYRYIFRIDLKGWQIP